MIDLRGCKIKFLKWLFGCKPKKDKIIYAEGDFKEENNPSWNFQGKYKKNTWEIQGNYERKNPIE